MIIVITREVTTLVTVFTTVAAIIVVYIQFQEFPVSFVTKSSAIFW